MSINLNTPTWRAETASISRYTTKLVRRRLSNPKSPTEGEVMSRGFKAALAGLCSATMLSMVVRCLSDGGQDSVRGSESTKETTVVGRDTSYLDWTCKFAAPKLQFKWKKGERCDIRVTARPAPTVKFIDVINKRVPEEMSNRIMELLSDLEPAKEIDASLRTYYILDIRNETQAERQSIYVDVLHSDFERRFVVSINGRPFFAAGGKRFEKDSKHPAMEILDNVGAFR